MNLKSPVLEVTSQLCASEVYVQHLHNIFTLCADLHLLYWDVILAVGARLGPHGTIYVLMSPHEEELNVLATLGALDLTIFTDLTVRL